MTFNKLTIKNFRNFADISIALANRNVFFGMNDIGKTNLLWALRFVFDYNVRKNGFQLTDFHEMNTDENIEIVLTLNLNETNNADNEKIIAKAGTSMVSGERILYIKLTSQYQIEQRIYLASLEWGNDIEHLEKVKSNGSFTDLDKIFKVNNIDATINLDEIFKQNFNHLLDKSRDDQEDLKVKQAALNESIRNLSSINTLSSALNDEFVKYTNRSVRLSFSVETFSLDPYKSIKPYMQKDGQTVNYPLSGDGQRKLASYSILRYKSLKDNHRYINLYFVEEPENHLHQTALAKLSKVLFDNEEFKFLFVTTHSNELLIDMDNINLVRIFNKGIIASASVCYSVPEEYAKLKKCLNSTLAKALFYNRVLLVEGQSEYVLFDAILHNDDYKAKGLIILPVNGIAFYEYLKILLKLNIEVIIKTDNDIRLYNENVILLGLDRIKKLFLLYAQETNNEELQNTINTMTDFIKPETVPTNKADIAYKTNLFSLNNIFITSVQTANIFLSKIDLENDLHEILERVDVAELQSKKLYNMVDFVPTLTNEEIATIKQHDNFTCLEVFINGNE
jgi:putative ATP-dependent endonuclease of OLD family